MHDEAQLLEAVAKLREAMDLDFPEPLLFDDDGQSLPARGQLLGVLVQILSGWLSDPDVQKRLLDLLLGILTRPSQG